MNVHRPPDLTEQQFAVLELILPDADGLPAPKYYDVLTLLRAATIMYPESTWLRDLARPWFQYQIDLKRAEVAADNAPAPEWPICICGDYRWRHDGGKHRCRGRSSDLCECTCTRYEPRDDT